MNPMHQNIHGVNLDEVEAGDSQPFRADGYRTMGIVEEANSAEDEFVLTEHTGIESFEHTLDGDALRQRMTEVRDAITDESFAKLGEGDAVVAYIEGHECNSRVFVEDVDHDAGEVEVRGEVSAQTVARTIDRGLIHEPSE